MNNLITLTYWGEFKNQAEHLELLLFLDIWKKYEMRKFPHLKYIEEYLIDSQTFLCLLILMEEVNEK